MLRGGSAEVGAGDAQAVDPTTEAALDGGVSDIVVDTDRLRIEIFQHDIEVPDGSAYQADAGVGVIHGAGLVTGIESGQLGHARLELFELEGERTICIDLKGAPAVMMDSQLRHGLEDVLRERSLGVDDVGGQHGDFEAVLSNRRDELGKILAHTLGLDVPALAHGEVDAIEADVGGAEGEGVTLQKLELLR